MGRMILAALTLLLIGGGIAAFIYTGRQYDVLWQTHLALSAMITVLLAGVVAICAVAPWWMHR